MKYPAAKVIAITGGKGGIGKTNIAVNIAASMSRLGKNTYLLDADFGLCNVDILLGLQSRYSLAHVLKNECSMDDLIVKGPFGLNVISGSIGMHQYAHLEAKDHIGIIDAFNHLSGNMDVLVIDTATGISDSVIRFSLAAQEIMVVVCDEPTSLADSYALIKTLNKGYGSHKFRIVTNRVRDSIEANKVFEKINKMATKYLDIVLTHVGWVPEDIYLKKAIQQQTAVIERYPSAISSIEMHKIAKKILTMPTQYELKGHMQFFMEQRLHVGTVATAQGIVI